MGGGLGDTSIARTTPYATSSKLQEISLKTTPSVINDEVQKPKATVKDLVLEYFSDIPELVEVARCESHFRQYDASGTVLRGEVNKSDTGVMQINIYYHKEVAEKLELDIYTLEGNMAYARYLYEREGLVPWNSSSKCWRGKVTEIALAR